MLLYRFYTTEEEYLLDQKGRILVRVNKRKDVSYFHFLMNQQREQFRFKTFQSLLSYCKKKRDKRISHKEQEEILVYAYFFMEEMYNNTRGNQGALLFFALSECHGERCVEVLYTGPFIRLVR